MQLIVALQKQTIYAFIHQIALMRE